MYFHKENEKGFMFFMMLYPHFPSYPKDISKVSIDLFALKKHKPQSTYPTQENYDLNLVARQCGSIPMTNRIMI